MLLIVWLMNFLLSFKSATPPRLNRRSFRPFLEVEVLEVRDCPAGIWEWNGPAVAAPGSNWSNNNVGNNNPLGNFWLTQNPQGQFVAAGIGQYPGLAAGDSVLFNQATGPALLDVALPNPLLKLEFTGWGQTLTLNNNLKVTGAAGDFLLTDNSTITMAANTTLDLYDLGTAAQNPVNYWANGTITGGAQSEFDIDGTELYSGVGPNGPPMAALNLGTNMVIGKDPNDNNAVWFTLSNMQNNLTLTGINNFIDVEKGVLNLSQHFANKGPQLAQGGIAMVVNHTGTLAVQVESSVNRNDTPTPGVTDQVQIAGVVSSIGGGLSVAGGSALSISGKDANGRSYWQQQGAGGPGVTLSIGTNSNLTTAGTVQIDFGNVWLKVPNGGTADELDAAGGLLFGAANKTALTILDSGAGNGTVTIQGDVTLGAQTTTTMSFFGLTGFSDLIDVEKGKLTLNGTLSLMSRDRTAPEPAISVFDDGAFPPSITDNGITIVDNVNGKQDVGAVDKSNWQLWYFTVAIST